MNLEITPAPAYRKITELKAGAIFVKAGPKKIRMATDLIIFKSHKIDFIVWIAPANFMFASTYKKEIRKNLGEDLYKKVHFYTIESISLSDIRYLSLFDLADCYRTFCVVDESITIKNTEAGRTKRLLWIKSKFKYRLILSGLPLTQGLVDLYSQVEFMSSSILNMTQSQFLNIYLSPYDDGFSQYKKWSLPDEEKKLIEKMRPYIYESDLSIDYNVNYYDYDFELTKEEAAVYEDEKNQFLENNENIAFMAVVQKFQYLYTLAEDKINGLINLIDEIKTRGEKVIIYIKFWDEIDFFKECGKLNNKQFVVLSGRGGKRKAIRQFSEDIDVMFSTYGVDNLGQDLRLCNNIVFFSQTFDYKSKLLALQNFYQSGKTDGINVYNFWLNTGLDNLIRKNLNSKENVLSNVCKTMSKKEAMNL